MPKKHDDVSAAADLADELASDRAALEREPLSAGEALADARAQAGNDERAGLPAPKPGDPDYDWSQHYPEGTKLYRHTYPDGQVVMIRRFGDIYSKQWLRSIKHLEIEFDIESAAIDRAACEAARDLIDTRPCPVDGPDDFQELWKSWTSAGSGDDAKAVSAGE